MKLVLGDRAGGQEERNVDPALLTLISQALDWFERMKNGTAQGQSDIAAQDGVPRTDVSRALPLAFLTPDIVSAIVEGRQPSELTSNILRRAAPSLPSSWHAQRRTLGFESA